MDALHAESKGDLQSFLTITLEMGEGNIANDLVLKAIDHVSDRTIVNEEHENKHSVERTAVQQNVSLANTNACAQDEKNREGEMCKNESYSNPEDVGSPSKDNLLRCHSKQSLVKREEGNEEEKDDSYQQYTTIYREGSKLAERGINDFIHSEQTFEKSGDVGSPSKDSLLKREEGNEDANNDGYHQNRTMYREASKVTEHHVNDSFQSGKYQNVLTSKKDDDETSTFDKSDRKRTRKQQIPRRLMKIIPLDSGVGGTSGDPAGSPNEFRLFTGDRSFKLTALRDESNPNAPAPYLKVYHAQVEELKWRCNECNKEFAMKETLEKHKAAIHEGNAPYKCPTCNKGFILEQSYYAHLYVHTGKRQFECENCGKSFARKDTLTLHQKSHDIEPVYKCQFCDKQFTTSSTIIKHEVLVHNRQSKHSCDICGKFLPTPSLLQVHLRKHTGEKPFECDSCDKKFKSLSEIKAHQISLHGGNTKHACETCGKRFPKPSKLRIHERTHTGEKPYSCPECGKDFNVQGNLQKHIKIHKTQEISMAETVPDGMRPNQLDSLTIPGPSMFHI